MAGKTVEDGRIRVVIADSSSFVRLVLTDILGDVPQIAVVGTAITGEEAIRQVKTLRPHVLLMDMDLPQNSRLFILQRVASECPTPILLMSTTRHALSETEQPRLRELGVYDLLVKPASILQPQLRSMKEELVLKLLNFRTSQASQAKKMPLSEKQQKELIQLLPTKAPMHLHPVKVVVLGASTGGTPQVEMLVRWLPSDFIGCLLVAVHLPQTFVKTFVKRLKSLTPLKVAMARSGMLVEAGCILIAPGGRDMLLKEVHGRPGFAKVMLTDASDSRYDSPSIDLLMDSAAGIFGSDTIGVILTGMGRDGTKGMAAIQEAGGKTVVQNEHKFGVFGMAKSVMSSGMAQYVLDLPQIVSFIEMETTPGYGQQGSQRSSS